MAKPFSKLVLYQFPKVWLHFWGLKPKPSKGFQITKWRSHFVIWYYQVWRRGSAAALGAEGHRFNPYHLDTALSAESNSRKTCEVSFS